MRSYWHTECSSSEAVKFNWKQVKDNADSPDLNRLEGKQRKFRAKRKAAVFIFASRTQLTFLAQKPRTLASLARSDSPRGSD